MALFVQVVGPSAAVSAASSPQNAVITSTVNTTVGNYAFVGIGASGSTSCPTTVTDSVGNTYTAFGSTGSTAPNVQGYLAKITNQIVIGTTLNISGWSLTRNFEIAWVEVDLADTVAQDAVHRSTGTSTTPSDTLTPVAGSVQVLAVVAIGWALGDTGSIDIYDAEYENNAGADGQHPTQQIAVYLTMRDAVSAATTLNHTISPSDSWHIVQQSYSAVVPSNDWLPILGVT